MKLILLSKHFITPAQTALNEFLGKENKDITLAFCSNAGDPYEEDRKEYIELSRKELIDSGYKLVDLDLNSDIEEIKKILNSVDATFFTGGDYNYLLDLFKKSKFEHIYKKKLEQGLIHIGFSAGAMICSHNYDAYEVIERTDIHKEGLNIFPYYIFPHYFDKEKYTKVFEDAVKEGFEKLIPLTNHQGIIVDGDEWRIVSEN